MPNLLVVAGPNGCGKSTLTRMSGFRGLDIIDPDAIARSIASGEPLQAGREALRRRRYARSHANLPAAMARADLTVLYDNTDPDRPHREVAILGDETRWIAAAVPGWATAALARS